MNKITSSDENPRETRALARFAAVQAVVQARQNGSTLTQALHHAAQQPWDGRYYSPATIEDWVYRYQHASLPRCKTNRAETGASTGRWIRRRSKRCANCAANIRSSRSRR